MAAIPSKTDVVVIGAGVAGLAAARRLSIAGREVCLIDASDDIGGRIRTDHVDGLLLDRGFQLYNPSYSEGINVLDLKALDVKSFSPGVIVSIDGRNYKMADPKREPSWAIDSLLAPVGKISSKLKFARYAIGLALTKSKPPTYDQRTDAFLRAKFGPDLTNKVLRPFLAGVFLEPELATSKRFFDIALKSFISGSPGVPSLGMQEIPNQLAAQLPSGSIYLNVTAQAVASTMVRTDQGDIRCRSVVIATNARSASLLIPSLKVPPSNAVTTWYHLADCPGSDLTDGKSTLVIDGKKFDGPLDDPSRPLVNTVVMTNAAPSYASNGRTLISSSAIGVHASAQSELQVRSHLASLYKVPTGNWTHVATYPIPDALPMMTAPHDVEQSVRLSGGVYIAGDYRQVSSTNGALISGRRAAEALLTDDL
ncbi:MAG: FAD-dependent oxidoreductase [Actinobacteria bacterium]|nr:FAD-dependent oxidoreductase [Actinomycetota bacterium]NBO34990.1 FAD-dependent oxidoreductase [Actinomycetota bacterium]